MKKILICGLPNAGKTTLAVELQKHLPESVRIDGDQVRAMYGNDLDFSRKSRVVQAWRMRTLADSFKNEAEYVIASFVCPTREMRAAFEPDFIIYVKNPDSRPCPYPDTKEMFEVPEFADLVIDSDNLSYNINRIKQVMEAGSFHFKKPTAMFIGRFQTFHAGHKALILKGMQETDTDQAWIGVRDMPVSPKNPNGFEVIEQQILFAMRGYKIKVVQVPNIAAVCYGRDVGYDVIKISLTPELEAISGTKIRERINLEV